MKTLPVSQHTHAGHASHAASAFKASNAQELEELEAQEAQLDQELDEFGILLKKRFGDKETQDVLSAIDNAKSAVKKDVKDTQNPFFFFHGLTFTALNAFSALAKAINQLAADQPQIIASEMGISNDLVAPLLLNFSNAWLAQLQSDNNKLQQPGLTSSQIIQLQGQLNTDNAASSASSTGLNGVQSMVTQDVSSKTTTLQNLLQQMQQVVTGGINILSQDWVI